MPIGASNIPTLRLEVLQGLITNWMADPNLILQNLFNTSDSASDTIKWESKVGSRGLTPFVPPGSPAPRTSPLGVAEHRAKAAFMKEKMYFDEEFLNNIRKEGTSAEYKSAEQSLAEGMSILQNRMKRRKEWMFAKMITGGSFDYLTTGGLQISVDYDVPTANKVSLSAADKWNTGENRDILADITDARLVISKGNGGRITHAFLNSETLEYVATDDRLITLLTKSNFGDGNLFKADDMGSLIGANAQVLGTLLNIPNFVVYDEQFQLRSWLTAAVAVGASSCTVDDATDFEAGDTFRLNDVSAGTWEDMTIDSVTKSTATITFTGVTTAAYKVREDYGSATKYFIPKDKFIMMASQVDGQPIAEYINAPFGLDRHYGLKVDSNTEWDPEGIDIRVQDKGLPVLKQRDALYILTVE